MMLAEPVSILQNTTVEEPVFLNINKTTTNNNNNNVSNQTDEIDSLLTLPGFLEDGIGLPSSLMHVIYGEVEEEEYGTARSGCNDAFSVFGFLAFLLALVDLIMRLQAGNKRRKREDSSTCTVRVSSQDNPQLKEGTLAAYSMFRGFLNSMENEEENKSSCAKLSMCEAAREAANLGEIGEVIARVGSMNAVGWLRNMDQKIAKGIKQAGHLGSRKGDCSALYKCSSRPNHYRHPGHSFQNLTRGSQTFSKLAHHINSNNLDWESIF
ncbi:uncharacterized protein LOC111695748 [Eurytemora carolleeae]|uniref:uncharacterized protein LOC111695748 n=1 Tax=Eurytemora carolleeae TaxID=1294199 RepID=UPI000C76C076|nr:uncharacterized protein LOC111695748 [Eurytemora carolleeae]XP_023321055.1 uncharacterized protein LOC111695748 [Eurytemora carolleeae]|eukprot:XP_023320981.1 uncharacterized protein LOC111695748 [Eurytemora affinis]